ncbi:importin subunit beta-like [Diaphorina citri]|uniref:Importin subunit beta-like n=1 Tax=Diaphorina citri TaxID=121845 RepID=A0A3Q0J353_DIACI|nr:importin subunit beta-like [Diaphorina citri]
MATLSQSGGLESATVGPLVQKAVPTLIKLMYDPSVVVRDTCAWVFGRICEITPESAIAENSVQRSAVPPTTQYNDLQSLLCATLQSVLRKVTPQDAPQISDAIMTALLRMLSSDVGKAGGDGGGVQEDALMAVSTLVEVLGEGFVKYMDAFKPYLLMGLKNHNAYQVVTSAVGLIGDIARAMKSKILPHCDELMTLLLENLGDTNVNRSVKPQILSVFGDIAISIGPDFKKYLDVVLQTLVQASAAQVDRTDFDMIEYLNELRDGVLEAYTGIVQGLRGDNPTPGAPSPDLALLEPHVPHVVELIKIIALEPEHSDSNIANCAGLVGDLMSAYEGKFYKIIDVEPVQQLLVQGRRSTMAKTKQVSNWATKEIRKAAKTNQNSCYTLMRLKNHNAYQVSDKPYLLMGLKNHNAYQLKCQSKIQLDTTRRSTMAKTKQVSNWATKEIRKAAKTNQNTIPEAPAGSSDQWSQGRATCGYQCMLGIRQPFLKPLLEALINGLKAEPRVATNPFLKPLLEALINGLKAEPRVATNVCWAFNGLSDAAYEMATDSDEALQPETYCLSPYFDYIVQRLLETTDRPDGAQANLRSAAYEALMEMVKNAPRDCYATVQKTTMVILEKLNHVLQMGTHITSHNDRTQYNDLQSLLTSRYAYTQG